MHLIEDNIRHWEVIERRNYEKLESFLDKHNLKYVERKSFVINHCTFSKILDHLNLDNYHTNLESFTTYIGENYIIGSFDNSFPTASLDIVCHSPTREGIRKIFKYFEEKLNDLTLNAAFCSIGWCYSSKTGGYDQVIIPEILSDEVHAEAYPFIKNLDDFVEQYLKSEEQILLLMGPTGTGKTRLIRYILKSLHNLYEPGRYDEPIYIRYTTDEKLLNHDDFFVDFLRTDGKALIIEDVDVSLKPRDEGNVAMFRLLATSDGLVKNQNKKIIISTNITKVKEVDNALLRRGRCFSVIKFRKLIGGEIETVLDKLECEKDTSNLPNKMSLGEIYHIAQEKPIVTDMRDELDSIGF